MPLAEFAVREMSQMERRTGDSGAIGNGAEILIVMTLEEEKKIVVKELENIFTIDGRGRPAKALTFLRLIDNYGRELVLEEVKRLSERKNF